LQDADTYNWKEYDQLVRGLYKNNVAIVATIDYLPPRFIKGEHDDWSQSYDEYSRFVKALNERYGIQGSFIAENALGGHGIHYFEVFNEPNLPGYGWLLKGIDPIKYIDQYVNFLAITNRVLHEERKDSIIILGGLSRRTHGALPPENFIDEIYKRGGKNCFDVIAFHPYGMIDDLGEVNALLSTYLLPYGDAHKPIWLDEFGVNDETKRQEYLKKVFALRNTLNGFFWFTLIDPSADGEKFGLIDVHKKKHASYDIYKELMKKNKSN
jgi:hypothetical protein